MAISAAIACTCKLSARETSETSAWFLALGS